MNAAPSMLRSTAGSVSSTNRDTTLKGPAHDNRKLIFFCSSLSALKHVPQTLCVTTSMARSAAQTEPWTCSPIPPQATRIVDLCHINFVEPGLFICLAMSFFQNFTDGFPFSVSPTRGRDQAYSPALQRASFGFVALSGVTSFGKRLLFTSTTRQGHPGI